MSATNVVPCAYCGGPATQRDHVVPLSRGGPDTPANIVLACASCNASKGARLPSEWRTDAPLFVLEIEQRVSFACTNRDRRRRRDGRPKCVAHEWSCDGCGGRLLEHGGSTIPVSEFWQSWRYHWWRECDEGVVVAFAIFSNYDHCAEMEFSDRREWGVFDCSPLEPDPLRRALARLRWEPTARERATRVVAEVDSILRGNARTTYAERAS